MKTYHLTCSTDNNYLQYCEVMLCSVFENNRDLTFHVHLLHSELTNESISSLTEFCHRYNEKISFYQIDDTMLKDVNRRDNSPVSIATYYRILLPELLDQSIEKIFYLDCDVVVLGSIKPLYDINLDGYGVAAVKDASPYDSSHRKLMGHDLTNSAFCAGVMMINLDYWRKHNSKEALLEYSNTKQDKVYLEDQDALNYVFRNHWFQLPYKWARTPLSIGIVDQNMKRFDQYEYAFSPRIIHYAGPMKPWCDVWFPERKYYLHYLKISGIQTPIVKKVDRSFKFRTYKNVLRYYFNRYVRPLVPDIVELLFKDILNLFKLLIYFLKGFKSLTRFLFNRWLDKYKI